MSTTVPIHRNAPIITERAAKLAIDHCQAAHRTGEHVKFAREANASPRSNRVT